MKPKIDLYGMLGLERDADQVAISRAYRSRAKAAHPDAGGSPDKFHKVQTAYLVLSDPGKRAQYDDTGDWDDAAPQNPEQRVMALISEALMGVVQGDGDPVMADLVQHINKAFAKKVGAMRDQLRTVERAKSRTRKLRGRFKIGQSKVNRIEPLLEWQEATFADSIKKIQAAIEDHERAVEFLNDYQFDREIFQTMSIFSGTASSATTSFSF